MNENAGTPRGDRTVYLSALAIGLAFLAGAVAQILVHSIGFVTNLAYYGRISGEFASPGETQWSYPVRIAIPVLGGLIVGLMARYGSKAIRGHGIPEAMENILLNQSRIPARITILKPLSAAIAIGTGGPFGAEGPIIATGSALGSLIGQLLPTTADERKILLASGAAAGMAATFGSPVSAVLLAVELLLFEFRPRSLVPVALAAAVATGVRMAFTGSAAVFPMPEIAPASGWALASYIVMGIVCGFAAIVITKLVYGIEDAFEHLPVHWMWWPAIGGVAVGVVGVFSPMTLGVGYVNIEHLLAGNMAVQAVAFLCVTKLISWSISLGSGTSGGTLAPLFTIGSGLGASLGALGIILFPAAGIDLKVAALVGMAALFAGASRALLASVVFAFETTLQPMGLLPLLGGCTSAYFVSLLFMPHSIMTEKIARRGVKVPYEYSPDVLDLSYAREFMTAKVITILGEMSIAQAHNWVTSGEDGATHKVFPVLSRSGELLGCIARQAIIDSAPGKSSSDKISEIISNAPTVGEKTTLRTVVEKMLMAQVGHILVVDHDGSRKLTGILTRKDVFRAYQKSLSHNRNPKKSLSLKPVSRLQAEVVKIDH